jgi:single-strand DNA-binding protein
MLEAQALGNLGSDPELKYSANGQPFLRFNVASNGRTRTESGGFEEKTEWVRCTVFGQRAEALSPHLTKGQRVFVSGRLETRPWTTQQGEVRAGLEMIVNTVEFLSPRQDEQQQRQQPVAAGRGRPTQVDEDPDDLDSLPF